MGVAWRIAGLLALVFANGFFVAAEFAIVTVRKTRIDQMIAEGHLGARAVRRAISDPDRYIAATQLGITMASIGLGWIGEPALASMIQPLFAALPAGTVDSLLAEPAGDLTDILTYHVVGQRSSPAELNGATLTTLQGGTISTAKDGDSYKANDAKVVCGNIQTRNATVYLIDTVLMPKS